MPCICGTRRPPTPWRKYSKAHGMRLRCPACRIAPSLATLGRGHGDHDITEIWNEFIAQERAKLAALKPSPEPREGIPVWPPQAGYYATRLISGGPRVAVRIWFGNAIIDGEEQDRGEDWRCEIDGKTDYLERDRDTGYECRIPLHIDRAWPFCANERIAKQEYLFLIADARHAKEHRPDHPKASPRQRVDFNTMPLPF
jgi:hypothetical protein